MDIILLMLSLKKPFEDGVLRLIEFFGDVDFHISTILVHASLTDSRGMIFFWNAYACNQGAAELLKRIEGTPRLPRTDDGEFY